MTKTATKTTEDFDKRATDYVRQIMTIMKETEVESIAVMRMIEHTSKAFKAEYIRGREGMRAEAISMAIKLDALTGGLEK